MSTQINANLLKNFIVRTIGADKLTDKQAQKYGVEQDKFSEANKDQNDFLELDEILEDGDLYEQFATLFVEEREKKAEAKDAEKEKEEETKVKDKNGAGV